MKNQKIIIDDTMSIIVNGEVSDKAIDKGISTLYGMKIQRALDNFDAAVAEKKPIPKKLLRKIQEGVC